MRKNAESLGTVDTHTQYFLTNEEKTLVAFLHPKIDNNKAK